MPDKSHAAVQRGSTWDVYAGWPVPRPAYLASAAVHEWVAVPLSAPSGAAGLVPAAPTPSMGGIASITDAWGGAVAYGGTHFAVHGGGHADYGGNEIGAINIAADAPVWDLLIERTPYASLLGGSNYYADGRPTSRHTYYSLWWDPVGNRIMRFNSHSGFAYNGSSPNGDTTADVRTSDVDAFDIATGAWVTVGSYGQMPTQAGSETSLAQDSTTGDVYAWIEDGDIQKWTLATKTSATLADVGGVNGQGGALVVDPVNQRLVRVAGRADARVETWNVGGTTKTVRTCIGPAAAVFNGLTGSNHGWGICRDPVANAAYIMTSGAVLYRMRLDDFWVEQISGGATPAAPVNGVWGRLQYLSALRSIVYLANWASPVLVMRVG